VATKYGESALLLFRQALTEEGAMLINTRRDGHIHTALCHHAVGKMEEYVQAAILKNLTHICFLEHMEEGIHSLKISWLTEKDFDLYFAEGQRLRDKYSGTIFINIGVEVGFNPAHVSALQNRLAARNWDSVGISCHFHHLGTGQNHLNLVSRNETRIDTLSLQQAAAIEEEYYINLSKAVELLPGTVLCHLDAVLRHYPARDLLEPPWHLIDQLLDKVKEQDMAIEVNTSGITIRGEVFPCRKILTKAIQKGIPLTASSDAHRPESVGYCFEKLESICASTETYP
jgi:histidinol-phosphatase (PHP family)